MRIDFFPESDEVGLSVRTGGLGDIGAECGGLGGGWSFDVSNVETGASNGSGGLFDTSLTNFIEKG